MPHRYHMWFMYISALVGRIILVMGLMWTICRILVKCVGWKGYGSFVLTLLQSKDIWSSFLFPLRMVKVTPRVDISSRCIFCWCWYYEIPFQRLKKKSAVRKLTYICSIKFTPGSMEVMKRFGKEIRNYFSCILHN